MPSESLPHSIDVLETPVNATSETPTNARKWVVVFGMTLAILSFIDRVALSQSAPLISKSLHLSKSQMGSVFSAFLLSYAIFEVPSAWYGDRVGARKGLLRIVAAWSFFTALTGAAWNFISMVGIQFLFGMGDAGCFPLITKAFRAWVPQSERSRSQGYLWLAARWGAAFTPLLVVFVLRFMTWRLAFVLFGSLAIVWLIFFARWYQDDPQTHPATNTAERALLPKSLGTESHTVNFGILLRSRSVLLLALQYYFLSFAWYFYITWLPTFLVEHQHLTTQRGAFYAVIPLFCCGLGSLFCGLVSPYVARWTGSIDRSRKVMACTGFLGAGTALTIAPHATTLNGTMALMGLACFFNDFVIPHAWASCMDIGGRKAASSVAGTMNLMGNVAGISSSMLGGMLLQQGDANWTLFISILGGAYFFGFLCWPFIRSTTPLEADSE